MTNIIVLDNSINSRLLWPDIESPKNNDYAIATINVAEDGADLRVPTIWHYEMAQVAQRLLRLEQVTDAQVTQYFTLLQLLPLRTDTESHMNTVAATFALSRQYRLSIYDAAYLELALRLGAALASNDSTLKHAAEKAGITNFTV